MLEKRPLSHYVANFLWDLWCIISVVGLWPRFLEPRLLKKKKSFVKIKDLEGFKILHFSDLHMSSSLSSLLLRKIVRAKRKYKPDLVVFTGDFMCCSKMSSQSRKRLNTFLKQMDAPYGSYCVLGNHDYEEYVTQDPVTKTYRVGGYIHPLLFKLAGVVFRKTSGEDTGVPHLEPSPMLMDSLKDTPFVCLNNECHQIFIKGAKLNICGLGDFWAGQYKPQQAFEKYDKAVPGIVLTHNPETFWDLTNYPGDLLLAGHTHGGQVNIPFLRDLFFPIQWKQFREGNITLGNKQCIITRGIGCVIPFRWFASPQVVLIEFAKEGK